MVKALKPVLTRRDVVDRQRDIIQALCDRRPPLRLFKDDESGLTDSALQDWIGLRLSKKFSYATAISVLEAAESSQSVNPDHAATATRSERGLDAIAARRWG